ncbi:vegetative incompatibility protein HET-E-1 [Colletotrichum musicola]|uniref:Vegetative incompatibility protein HET-E-1 n=1 Tax=Colletotrichum musicola TaxID=2175873 RepID=A0A8H6KEY7_9PEZI|nr:vegetative incompatibility protein HET-E-1 [Colletotrichum musicola]
MPDYPPPRIQAEFSNFGTGAQQNHTGSGNQYSNSGSGVQYNAESITFSTKEKDNFLADLRVTDPRDDKTRIERTKGTLLFDSYRWILDHDDFRQWPTERRLTWIKGSPGNGKTMLLCGIIDQLVGMGYESTFFFFCQATDARLNTATSVLRGLLYLILDRNPFLVDLLRAKYDRAGAGKQLFEDINSWYVLCKMLLFAVSHESLHDVVLVVDALDECTSGLDHLLSFIIELIAYVKIVISSRLWLSIDRDLAAALEDTKIYLSLELNEEVISAAVNNYIHHKILSLLDADHCKQVLAVMSIVSRPLDFAELASLLGHIGYLEEIVEECGSLLTVREGVVYFIHQSAKDFLVGQADKIMPSGIGPSHNLILSKLLQTTSNTLRCNIYNIHEHGIALDDICVPTPDPLAPVRYACVYWGDHVIDESAGQQQAGQVCAFVTRHFLHWLEALSLLRGMSEGISSMSRIQRIFENGNA